MILRAKATKKCGHMEDESGIIGADHSYTGF